MKTIEIKKALYKEKPLATLIKIQNGKAQDMTETISQPHGPDIEIQSHNSLIVLSDLNDRHQIIIDKENIPKLIAVLNRMAVVTGLK